MEPNTIRSITPIRFYIFIGGTPIRLKSPRFQAAFLIFPCYLPSCSNTNEGHITSFSVVFCFLFILLPLCPSTAGLKVTTITLAPSANSRRPWARGCDCDSNRIMRTKNTELLVVGVGWSTDPRAGPVIHLSAVGIHYKYCTRVRVGLLKMPASRHGIIMHIGEKKTILLSIPDKSVIPDLITRDFGRQKHPRHVCAPRFSRPVNSSPPRPRYNSARPSARYYYKTITI